MTIMPYGLQPFVEKHLYKKKKKTCEIISPIL